MHAASMQPRSKIRAAVQRHAACNVNRCCVFKRAVCTSQTVEYHIVPGSVILYDAFTNGQALSTLVPGNLVVRLCSVLRDCGMLCCRTWVKPSVRRLVLLPTRAPNPAPSLSGPRFSLQATYDRVTPEYQLRPKKNRRSPHNPDPVLALTLS